MINAMMVALLVALPGCEKRMPDERSSTPAATTELGALPKLISLPKTPTEVKWEVLERAQGQASTLRALLRFSEADYASIVDGSEVYDRRDNERIDPQVYDTFISDAAKHGIEVIERGRYYELVGVEPRKANLFWNAKLSPYVNGRITPLRDGYIYVSMEAS